MDFWDTVLGNDLAHALINSLPELAETLARKKQYGIILPTPDVVSYIDKRIQAGERYIASFDHGNDKTYVIMEFDKGEKNYE